MTQDTGMAQFIRGLVRFVFILCYVAFMWASIHHVATFFNNFEQDNGNTFGSYLLAGAFDITALVTTIGVMFFRKSMPGHIQFILWAFIIGIAVYSFVINWEYAQHFQTASLIMQPTGKTIAVYDHNNVLHYVPEMQTNDRLLFINPILASGFTIFALIYSVVAEFFGSKAPTIEELRAKQQYLEETATVLDSIKKLEGQRKGKSIIATVKDTAMEARAAVSEVLTSEDKGSAVVSPVAQKTEPQSEPVAVENVALPVSVQVPQQETIVEPAREIMSEPVAETDEEPQSETDYLDEFEDAGSLSVSTDEHESVSTLVSPQPRITGKLPETVVKPERNTDKLKKLSARETKKPARETDTIKTIRRMVKRNPAIEPVEIAKKVNVTRQYAGRVKTQILSEISA